jgi:predicted DNA-binding mobile mystery protein A
MKKNKKATTLTRKQLDKRLQKIARSGLFVPPQGWIASIRSALGMTQSQLAARLGMSRQNLNKLEKSELAGTLEIKTLRKVAQSLGCEISYVLLPKTSLDDTVIKQAAIVASKIVGETEKHMRLEKQGTQSHFQKKSVSDLAEEIAHEGGKKLWGTHDKED